MRCGGREGGAEMRREALLLQLIMQAYTIMDPVNKYRHGVLVGNFVEDKFGCDLHQQGPLPDAPKATSSQLVHSLASSLHTTNPLLAPQQPSQAHFTSTARSLHQEPYRRPEDSTSYGIFHNQNSNPKVPLVANNAKLEERQEGEGKAYAATRQQLANKFTRPNGHDPVLDSLSQQIPDILTGEILKSKANLGVEPKSKISQVKAKSINPYGTYSLVKPEIQKFQEVEYNKFVYPHFKGERRDVLFGHGLALEDFQQRQLSTTYDLSFNQKVMPQTQVNSFYQPDCRSSAREYNRQTVHEKNYQVNVPSVGNGEVLAQDKAARPYQPYTSSYDANHLKHEYLRK